MFPTTTWPRVVQTTLESEWSEKDSGEGSPGPVLKDRVRVLYLSGSTEELTYKNEKSEVYFSLNWLRLGLTEHVLAEDRLDGVFKGRLVSGESLDRIFGSGSSQGMYLSCVQFRLSRLRFRQSKGTGDLNRGSGLLYYYNHRREITHKSDLITLRFMKGTEWSKLRIVFRIYHPQ